MPHHTAVTITIVLTITWLTAH